MIHVKCPHCGSTLSVPEEYKNDKQLHCGVCNQNFKNTYTPPKTKRSQSSFNNNATRHTSKKQEFSLKGKLITTAIIFFLIFIGYGACEDGEDGGVKSKVENSGWDGSVLQVKQYLKRTLKDPDSYQSIQWGKVHELNNGTYEVWHKFRAKNSFGGYVVSWMSFILDADGNVIDSRVISEE